MTELDNIKVSATVIVISKDDKVLIVQRLPDKAFPNLWTVAGGKLQSDDGEQRSEGFLYNSVEACARRELFEETGIHIWNTKLNYLCSITTIWGETRRVILSYYVILNKDADKIKLTLSECQDARWIENYMIDSYNFIPDIGGEIKEVFKILKQEREAIMERIIKNGA
jgi:8-oxo-dGTP pyrophosphatase MutT (NUDIX family)